MRVISNQSLITYHDVLTLGLGERAARGVGVVVALLRVLYVVEPADIAHLQLFKSIMK